ncbi:MAG: tRNA (adenosine(37)-N6)-threonylcarbamoyltransferase complex transferase subunit TsaD [Planctomycetes bacterium]|nr:tRNA (adenosine(37)-N6)-threonylcarbamoyltransferase complex transferase subunit TsaD [Planctomycetota bacterium]
MRVLGIETSCDETAAAVVEDGHRVLSSVVRSQDALHAPWGGVVPEVAGRAHVESLGAVVEEAQGRAGAGPEAVAVTSGPGLVGSLLVGVAWARAHAWALGLPLAAVDHLESHCYAARMDHPDLAYPYLALLVSGGHTAVYLCEAPGRQRALGRTRDDAAGEAFDKVASMLGLGYPGGPAVERAARGGDPAAVAFPRPLPAGGPHGLDFSFSGLKTAVLYAVRGQDARGTAASSGLPVADLAASFQEAVVDCLVARALEAARRTGVRRLALGGGVGANGRLRSRLVEAGGEAGLDVRLPGAALCTDNAAMVAGLGYHLLAAGRVAPADLAVRPRG